MVGIQVPIKQNDQEENVKPYLFKLINGIRLDNQFFIECGTTNSYYKIGYVGSFGFKDGVETMRGRMIDNMDNEMEHILVYKESI